MDIFAFRKTHLHTGRCGCLYETTSEWVCRSCASTPWWATSEVQVHGDEFATQKEKVCYVFKMLICML